MPLADEDMEQLRRLGYVGPARIDYSDVRIGDEVQTLSKWVDGRWRRGRVARVLAFSNYAWATHRVTAWLSDGHGVGCPLVILRRGDGPPPDYTRHMPSPGYGYERSAL